MVRYAGSVFNTGITIMQRIKQLHPLSMEHHLSLLLAQKAMKAADEGDPEEIQALCAEICKEYPQVWVKHFDNEERYIFTPFGDRTGEIQKMCVQLTSEHRQFDAYVQQMEAGDYSVLYEFGKLLKSHTRLEERELFPLISEVLSSDELDAIYLGIS